MERIKGCTHNTLVKITNEYMGSQWALFMPTVAFTGAHKGPPCVRLLQPYPTCPCCLATSSTLESMFDMATEDSWVPTPSAVSVWSNTRTVIFR